MKFRTKVLIVGLTVLSISLAIISYLTVRKNFDMALENALENAITENNLLQAGIEYELLKVINNDGKGKLETALETIGARTAAGIISGESSFFIRYGEKYVYISDTDNSYVPDELFEEMTIGKKNYVYSDENGSKYIYVSSVNPVDSLELNIVSKRNIDSVYTFLDTLISYYRLITGIVLVLAGGTLWFISRILTKPLEQLSKVTEEIGKGNYSIRTDIKTNDEVGILSDKFNEMAMAIDTHVNELNDMVKRREQFVADFTHEIKTPMTAIIGYADTLRSYEFDRQDEITALNYIFSEGKRLEKMSGKLFELIYLRSNDIELKPYHVRDIASEIARIVAPILKEKNVTLVSEIESGMVLADKELLTTALVNIIDNAGKASKPGDKVYLGGKASDNSYVISVTDNGIGMSEEQISKICDEFYMADKSRSRKAGGAGLGMSLASIIIDKHKAKLVIDSKLGEGTTMQIYFTTTRPQGEDK